MTPATTFDGDNDVDENYKDNNNVNLLLGAHGRLCSKEMMPIQLLNKLLQTPTKMFRLPLTLVESVMFKENEKALLSAQLSFQLFVQHLAEFYCFPLLCAFADNKKLKRKETEPPNKKERKTSASSNGPNLFSTSNINQDNTFLQRPLFYKWILFFAT